MEQLTYLKNFYLEKSSKIFEKFSLFLKLNSDKILTILLYLIFLFIIYLISKKIVSNIIKLSLKLKNVPVSQDRLITLSSVFNSILKIFFIFSFLILVLKELDINIIHIITGAGIIGAAIVYIFQGLIQDIIKGWILIFEDQMRKGEWVNINNTLTGKVKEFNLRHVVLKEPNGSLIFIPSSQINTIFNLSRELTRNSIKVKIKKPDEIQEFLQNFEEFLLSLKNLDIQKLKIANINIAENFIEIQITFDCKFISKEKILNNLKLEIYKYLKDSLIEIT